MATKKPVEIAAAPADVQAVAVSQNEGSGDPSAHDLALYEGTEGKTQGLLFGRCSCGGFQALRHTDRERLEELHAKHVERRKVKEQQAAERRAAKRERLKEERVARAIAAAENQEV